MNQAGIDPCHGIDYSVICPCCGGVTLQHAGQDEICNVCGWEDDPFAFDHPENSDGANNMSLHEARKIWNETRRRIK